MTTATQHILTLDRLLDDAEQTALTAEIELAAMAFDLIAANARIATLEAEAAAARAVIGEQHQIIEAHQHAAVLAMEAHRRQAAELDRWRARVMGGLWLWAPEGSAN